MSTMPTKAELTQKIFIEKLNSLLKQYQANLYFSVGDCSDTHGLYEEELRVTIQVDGKPHDFQLTEGWTYE